jgi:AAA family ATP:ADP antiporter
VGRNAGDETGTASTGGGGLAARLLAPFAEVRPGEAGTALAMAAQAFLLLTVYYLLKPVRESWILPGVAGIDGAELKTYLAAVQALALVVVARGWGALAHRLRRDRLIGTAIVVAIACLAGFWALHAIGIEVAIAFSLWLGAFQLLLIAQFWSFATDLYTPERGRRVFAVLGAGAALGSVLGAQVARALMRWVDEPAWLLLVAAATLAFVPALATVVHRRERSPREEPAAAASIGGSPGLLVRLLADRYLRLVAAFTVLLNAIATIGEYALDRTLLESAAQAVAHGEVASVELYVGAFKADYYAAINLVVLVLQLFAVARVLRAIGERAALAILPAFVVVAAILALGAGSAALPMLGVLAVVRVLENGIAHSIQGTARQALYLVTTREGRWSGRALIDTAFWRAGDVLGAVLVASLAASGGSPMHALGVSLVLGLVWLAVVRSLGRAHAVRCAATG